MEKKVVKRGRPIKKTVIDGNAKYSKAPPVVDGLKVTKGEDGGDVVECESVHAAGWVDPNVPLDWSNRKIVSGPMRGE